MQAGLHPLQVTVAGDCALGRNVDFVGAWTEKRDTAGSGFSIGLSGLDLDGGRSSRGGHPENQKAGCLCLVRAGIPLLNSTGNTFSRKHTTQ